MNIKDLMQFEGEDATPNAANMIEDFRSIGYSLETAVADIIDNSIAAEARNVWIDFSWEGEDTCLSITDDGNGMSKDQLLNAMRPGSKNPLSDRSSEDLGRFGMGLKTASFSQCRILTVATKAKNSLINHRCWNIDYVKDTGKWKLLEYLDDESRIERLKNCKKGTAVLWQNIDRLVADTSADNEEHLRIFLERIKEMELHLSMVFHLFIEEKKLTLWINDVKLEPWDPYIKDHPKSKLIFESVLRDNITVSSYVLPHHSDLGRESFEKASGIKGWNAHQGFYIYRNRRMLISGEWLGLYKQEEHSKLSRILVNVPNTWNMDSEWQLDIKKSSVQLPHDIRQELKKIADDSRRDAVEVYRQIGKHKRVKSDKEDVPVWLPHKWNGKRCYVINKDHPLVKNFIEENKDNNARMKRFFRLIEETLPLGTIIISESEHQDNQHAPFEGKSISDLVVMVIELYNELIKSGCSKETAIEEILRTEPFNYYPELAENINNL